MAKWRKEFWDSFPSCAHNMEEFKSVTFSSAMIELEMLLKEKVKKEDITSICKIMDFVGKWYDMNNNAHYGVAIACFYEHCLCSENKNILGLIRTKIPKDIKKELVTFAYDHKTVYGYAEPPNKILKKR